MMGLAPLSYPTLEAWARLNEIDLIPEEVDALLQLDSAILHPDPPKKAARPEDAKTELPQEIKPARRGRGWPSAKPGVQPVLDTGN